MIPVANPIPKPSTFDTRCATPGNQWLKDNPTNTVKSKKKKKEPKPPNLWSDFENELAEGFQFRCGWLAYEITEGHVDHYLSQGNHRPLTYSWNNYRYICGSLNSSKQDLDDTILDPFEIKIGWFEVDLPSLLLRISSIPSDIIRTKADYTLKRLRLDRQKYRRNRERRYASYKLGKMSLDLLREQDPLLAEAVDRHTLKYPGQPLP